MPPLRPWRCAWAKAVGADPPWIPCPPGRSRFSGTSALGQTVREIAEAYHLSTKTVDTYRARLLKKLNLRNNAELSRFALQNRLVEL